MTNAEKFKEVFGIDFEYNLENVCPRPHTGVCYYDDAGDEDCDTCVYEYWENNEYQGEPTIPLSVIEKIHDAIDNADSDDFYEDEHGYITDSMLTREHVHEIIDKAVRSVYMSDFLHESMIRKMTNELFDENGYPNIKEYTEGQVRDAFNSGYAVGQEEGAKFEVLKALEDVRAEIEALYDGDVCAKEHNCDKDVLDIIDRKIAEVKGDNEND